VRVAGGQLLFSHPDEQKLCAGTWRVVQLARNGPIGGVEIEIPEPPA
jgi:hypothetical protein